MKTKRKIYVRKFKHKYSMKVIIGENQTQIAEGYFVKRKKQQQKKTKRNGKKWEHRTYTEKRRR